MLQLVWKRKKERRGGKGRPSGGVQKSAMGDPFSVNGVTKRERPSPPRSRTAAQKKGENADASCFFWKGHGL